MMTLSEDCARRPVWAVEVTLVSDHNFYTGIGGNLRDGGIFVATYHPPPPGQDVDLALAMPELNRVFILRGRVRWIRSLEVSSPDLPPGCGLQWHSLAKDALQAIEEFVQCRDTLLYEHA